MSIPSSQQGEMLAEQKKGPNIRYLITGWNVKHTDQLVVKLFFDKMFVNFHMFGSIMENWVLGNRDCNFVVTIYFHRRFRCFQFFQLSFDPHTLTYPLSNCPKLNFCTTSCYNILFFISPRNKISSHKGTLT